MRRLKLTLGVLMIAALFVPLSECSHGKKPDAPPPPKPLAQKIFPRSDAHTDYDYGALRLAPSLNGAITAIAFAWPLTFALCNRLVAGNATPGFSSHSNCCSARRPFIGFTP